MSWRRAATFFTPIFFLGTTSGFFPAGPSAEAQAALPVDQIVERMQEHEASQARELKHYEAVRHYQVQYKGLGAHLAAAMDVDLNYDSATGKSFRIVSQSGSKLLCDKVLKRAVESEEEASKDKSSTALNATNYRFQLTGNEAVDGHPSYILEVEPLRKSKFLYRGRVFVDAADFAVTKIEVEPAQNPSFWIKSTEIENINEKTGGVWLPEKNRSESKIRVGGTAVLTIDYGTYRVTLAGQREVGGWQARSGAGGAVPERAEGKAAKGTAF